MAKKSDRITKIKYQFKKTFNQNELTDSKKIKIVRSLLDAQIDGTDVVSDVAKAPTNLFGVDINWSLDGKNVTLITDTIVLEDDLADVVIPVAPQDPEGLLYLYNGVKTEAFKLHNNELFQLTV